MDTSKSKPTPAGILQPPSVSPALSVSQASEVSQTTIILRSATSKSAVVSPSAETTQFTSTESPEVASSANLQIASVSSGKSGSQLSANVKCFILESIPVETRENIIILVVQREKMVMPNNYAAEYENWKESTIRRGGEWTMVKPVTHVLALARTCKQFNTEVMPLFFLHNQFKLFRTEELFSFLNRIPYSYRLKLRSVSFVWIGYRSKDAFALLQECVYLEKLEIIVHVSTERLNRKTKDYDLLFAYGIGTLKKLRVKQPKKLTLVVRAAKLLEDIHRPDLKNFIEDSGTAWHGTALQTRLTTDAKAEELENILRAEILKDEVGVSEKRIVHTKKLEEKMAAAKRSARIKDKKVKPNYYINEHDDDDDIESEAETADEKDAGTNWIDLSKNVDKLSKAISALRPLV